MKSLIKYFAFAVFVLLISTCKKKTTIKVKLLNPALNEYVANATIVLVERKTGGLFSKDFECKEIANAVTDNGGECFFDNEKLRSGSGYDYFCAVKESWGLHQSYPCAGIAERFIKKGGDQDWLVTDYTEGYVQIQYNNLLNPSQPADSLDVVLYTNGYHDPVTNSEVKDGGGIFYASPYFGCNGYPFASVVLLPKIKCPGSKLILKIYKRKMGTITTNVDTIKAYPNKTTAIEVNW
jgi:hypothetical protein